MSDPPTLGVSVHVVTQLDLPVFGERRGGGGGGVGSQGHSQLARLTPRANADEVCGRRKREAPDHCDVMGSRDHTGRLVHRMDCVCSEFTERAEVSRVTVQTNG